MGLPGNNFNKNENCNILRSDISCTIRAIWSRELKIQAPQHPVPNSMDRPMLMTKNYSIASLDVPLSEIWLRVGPGGRMVYCHQGGCEHILSVRDVRCFDPECDPRLVSDYPLQLVGIGCLQQRPCSVCSAKSCKLVTYDDQVASSSPFFWCADCFRALHYDENGKALFTDFKVFPYSMEYHSFVVQKPARV